ncbi:MAG: kynureninase [Bacteroidota bacterium]
MIPQQQLYSFDLVCAQQLDKQDPLADFRNRFHLPVQSSGEPYLYFTGNSLGCQPKGTAEAIKVELEDWKRLGVEGHLHARNPWMPYHERLTDSLSKIVGANPGEVVAMGALTANLHFLLVSFYQPKGRRMKILMEDDAFPSDSYALNSQVAFHGYTPEEAIIRLKPRSGEYYLRTEDILEVIEQEGDQVATLLMGGVNYFTGQAFEMGKITEAAHKQGITVGFDLAHAVGNFPLKLHGWGVDFAAWCSYKYLNAGPGAVAGVFVHERHAHNPDLPRFAGWWGHDKERRFLMEPDFVPVPGAEGWQLSNAPVLSMAALRASLDLFDEAGMQRLRAKSELLTGYLAYLIDQIPGISYITPKDPVQRGCQLSLVLDQGGKEVFDQLEAKGVICDWREPNVIRAAPVPLYNSFEEVYHFGRLLREILNG